MFRLTKNRKGLTLVEIIVALAILGIVAVSILTIFTGSYSTIFMMGRKTKAMNETAQNYMDQIVTGVVEYSDVHPGNIVISPPTTDANSGLQKITVTVTYQDGKTIKLVSLIP